MDFVVKRARTSRDKRKGQEAELGAHSNFGLPRFGSLRHGFVAQCYIRAFNRILLVL